MAIRRKCLLDPQAGPEDRSFTVDPRDVSQPVITASLDWRSLEREASVITAAVKPSLYLSLPLGNGEELMDEQVVWKRFSSSSSSFGIINRSCAEVSIVSCLSTLSFSWRRRKTGGSMRITFISFLWLVRKGKESYSWSNRWPFTGEERKG